MAAQPDQAYDPRGLIEFLAKAASDDAIELLVLYGSAARGDYSVTTRISISSSTAR